MKKIKRVLSITLCVLTILCILCTSVFALSPTLPELDIDNLTLYTPASNLQSVIVRSYDEDGNYGYVSLSSPYGFLEKTPTNLFLSNTSTSYRYSIGIYKPNLDLYFNVDTHLEPYSGSSGAYIRETVNFSDLYMQPFDVSFVYGNSIMPFESVSSRTNSFTRYPFYTNYIVEFGTWSDYTDDATLVVEITADVLTFDYSYDNSTNSYVFESGPEFTTVYSKDSVEIIYDNDLSIENGYTIYGVSFSPFLDIQDRCMNLLMDHTVDHEQFPYTFIDNMTVSMYAYSASDPSVEFFVHSLENVDYVYQHYNLSYIWYPPLYDHALKIFNEMFPTYTQDEGYIDLDFNDFLISVLDMFNVPLFGYFSLADLLFGIAGIGLLIWFIKMFAGG